MIHINLQNLSKENLYRKVLQAIEHICEENGIGREFGCISTACQEVVEYLLQRTADFSVTLDVYVESGSMDFSFSAEDPIFHAFEEYGKRENILSALADKMSISSDNKAVTLTFLVKTHPVVTREMTPAEKVHHF